MSGIVINEKDYYRKVYGGWLGKNIGGTLGVPVEGQMELLDLKFYPVLPDEPLENDDLDMQLVWLHALEQYGAKLTARELGQEWMEHIFFPFDEYGYSLANLRRGLTAPVAGWFNNPFNDCMGSPIRSEIWAMISPGAPDRAAAYAYEDAIVDHAGGEGVYGEMFFAAIESAAFIESDRDTLIAIGMSYIPEESRTARAMRDLLRWHQEGFDWIETRALILEHHGSSNFTDAPQNIAFTILGWLFGEDFGDAILKTVNCGYDTDCTAATLGAILGIIGGPESLPEHWVEPVGDRVVVSPPIKGFPAPANLDELTSRTIRIGREVIAAWNLDVRFSSTESTSGTAEPLSGAAQVILPPQQNRYLLPRGTTAENLGLELLVDYGNDGPAIGQNGNKEISFKLTNLSRITWKGVAELRLPTGWTQEASSKVPFEIAAGASVKWNTVVLHGGDVLSYYDITLLVHRLHDGLIWNTEAVNLSLVPATEWAIEGPAGESAHVQFPGNRLLFKEALGTDAPGIYKASSLVRVPTDRKVLWITPTEMPIKLSMDGRVVIDCREETVFMPAFHRALPGKSVELDMKAGDYLLELEVEKGSDPLNLIVVPVASYDTDTPGPHYFMTDILFLSAK